MQYYAMCAGDHFPNMVWTGEVRETREAAQKDVESHKEETGHDAQVMEL